MLWKPIFSIPRHPHRADGVEPEILNGISTQQAGHWLAFRRGLLTSFANPKTAAFFGSLFVTTFPPQTPSWVYMVTSAIVFLISQIWYSLETCFYSITAIRRAYHRTKSMLDCITEGILAALGLRLLLAEE